MTVDLERFLFPVTRLDAQEIENDLSVPRRGEGSLVATSRMTLNPAGKRKVSVAPLTVQRGSGKHLADRAERIRAHITAGLNLLSSMNAGRNSSVSGVLENLPVSGLRLPVQLLQGHDLLLDVMSPTDPVLRCDIDIPCEIDQAHDEALGALYALGLLGAFCYASDGDERSAILAALAVYEDLNSGLQQAIQGLLAQPTIDAGGIFARFLSDAAGASTHEKIRLSAWVRSRGQIELPYHSERVRRAIREETDLTALRQRVYNEIRGTYVPAVDEATCRRVSQWALENDIRLVGGRFSRAFYLDAMLLASSQVLPGRSLLPGIAAFEKAYEAAALDLTTEDVGLSYDAVGGEAQKIANLASKESVSVAEAVGVLHRFTVSVRDLESKAHKALDSAELDNRDAIAAEKRTGRGRGRILKGLAQDRKQIRTHADSLMSAVSDLQTALVEGAKREPSFVVFFQRLTPVGSLNMGLVNELEDPFFGEDDEVHELIRECGHRMYVTPNLHAWLRHVDDWIEALPAYATYEIIPDSGGSYKIRTWVQRRVIEDLYRSHAPDWALNIEEVVDLEHVSLAREIVATRMGLLTQAEKLASKDDPGPGARPAEREEAIRQVMKEHGDPKDIAAVAAVVAETYNQLCETVATARQTQDLPRIEALSRVLESDTSPGNLLAQARRSARGGKRGLAQACTRLVASRKLKTQAGVLASLALRRRRNLPCVHVLTTLGPGETEVNVQGWLEESMSLFVLSRAHGLESAAQRRVSRYRDRLVAVGGRLVADLDLGGDLHRLILEDGLSSEIEADREKGILRLLASYPEVASEAARLALLIDREETRGSRSKEARDASEPASVTDYIAKHPQLEKAAVRKVLENNQLGTAVRARMKASGASRADAGAAVVAANSDYVKEKESVLLADARARAVDSLGLADQVATYMRTRLDPAMAIIRARRDLIGENNLSKEMNNPRFRYEATGPYKKYNLLYTPSRVDLGADEVESVRDVPKWLGGLDGDAANAGLALYSLYNVAGPTAVPSPRLAEFLKVGENFFSRGGVYYLSLAAAANIDAIGIGDFEFFRDQWNMRGDRTVLPTGETYGGFCVPKEFSLLFSIIITAVNPNTSGELLTTFGVPKEAQAAVVGDLRKLLRMRLDCRDDMDWEARAAQFLDQRYTEYFTQLGKAGYIARLPQLATTLEKAGVLSSANEKNRALGFQFTYWVNKKAQGLEEINRAGVFRKVHMIRQLIDEARRLNPAVPRDEKIIGVMGAPYKEGARKHGREIPITDVRFSAGARKLEIYAGTAEDHILKDIDPEGREIITRMFRGWQSPADIRVVGTCTGSDLLNHVPGAGLEEVQAQVFQKLFEAGLDDSMIEANSIVYGGDLEQWPGIKERPEAERRDLIDAVGPQIHLVVLEKRGVLRTYAQAVQGVDFLDLSIPDPELLDLLDDLPRLIYLMKRGRPDSALAFADGTSGGRRRAFSFRYASCKEKVKELFALDENAVYGGIGLGKTTVEAWRAEMQGERDLSAALHDALVGGQRAEAEATYERIVAAIRRDRRADEAANDQIAARKFGVSAGRYRALATAYGRVERGLALGQLDFGTWLLLGGRHIVNGKQSPEQLERTREEFGAAVAKLPDTKARGSVAKLSESAVDDILSALVVPAYVPPPEGAYEEMETGIAGSLKAAEEQVSRLEGREERRRQARRIAALGVRLQSFRAAQKDVEACIPEGNLDAACDKAVAALGDPKNDVTHEAFGQFLCWASGAGRIHIAATTPDAGQQRDLLSLLKTVLNGGEVDSEAYVAFVSAMARSAEVAGADGDCADLEDTAKVLELCDIALLIEKTQDIDDAHEMMLELARFYDLTINNHVFDYPPYHYHKERTAAYEGFSRQEKFELFRRHHRWLYTHGRYLLAARTELKDRGPAYQDAWIGDADRDLMAIGLHLTDPAERFWFGYARLRDVSVLVHEGYVLPELFLDLDPAAIKADRRANVAIVYPHGNTTVPVAMEQGAKLSKNEKINLMLTPFPTIAETDKMDLKVVRAHDGLMYLSRTDYRAALQFSDVDSAEAAARARKVAEQGVLVAATFRRPITVHSIFFHFTHPLRPVIGTARVPLVQPIVWEAAAHLKCRLPEMLEGSGIPAPPQINWHKKTTATMSQKEAMAAIAKDLTAFAKKHDTVIVKPEKDSGGRSARILPLRQEGKILTDNVNELAELAYDICKTDNAVIQRVLRSHVRQLYTRDFLEDMVDRFARIGLAAQLDTAPATPLFSYFRLVLVRGAKGYDITHNITVVSTRGVANVGQGGLLYEYLDKIIEPRYRADLRREMVKAARKSMNAQRRYIRKNWREILEEYMEIHPEFRDTVRMEVGTDLTGFADTDIPFEMGDYMPVLLVDENDDLIRIFDPDKLEILPLYDDAGKPTAVKVYDESGKAIPRKDRAGRPLPLPMFDEQGKRIPRFDKDGSKISTLIVYKIEPNPGAGLWRPHNDQLPNERKGESVYRIFAGLGERGFDYKKELQKVARASGISTDAPETPGAAGRYVGSGLYEAPAPKAPSAGQAAEAVDRATLVDQAIDRAREELGQ